MTNFERKGLSFELKEADDTGVFSGYASVFGVIDDGRDVVERGAFTASLADWRAKGKWPKLLRNHDTRNLVGVWLEMREDSHGLFVKGQLTLEVQSAKEAYALLKAGALDGLSIGYRTVNDDFDRVTNVRKLQQVDLMEVSLVTIAMNQAATVTDVKGLEFNPRALEQELRRELNFSSGDAVKAVAIVKKHLQRDVGDNSSAAARDETGAMTGLLEAIRGVRSGLSS